MKQKIPVRTKLASIIICIASALIIVFIGYMALGSLKVWGQTFNTMTNAEGLMFWGSLGLAIAWGIMKTLEGFIREFAKSFKLIFN